MPHPPPLHPRSPCFSLSRCFSVTAHVWAGGRFGSRCAPFPRRGWPHRGPAGFRSRALPAGRSSECDARTISASARPRAHRIPRAARPKDCEGLARLAQVPIAPASHSITPGRRAPTWGGGAQPASRLAGFRLDSKLGLEPLRVIRRLRASRSDTAVAPRTGGCTGPREGRGPGRRVAAHRQGPSRSGIARPEKKTP